MRDTIFEDLICVPQVLTQCSLVCGLKVMRLVSKPIRQGMTAVICQATVTGTKECSLVAMLSKARLSRLRLVLKAGSSQLNSSLETLRRAILNVTFLEIDSILSSIDLQQLGPFLPHLTHLRLCGHITRDSLASLGRHCKSLHTLQVIGSMLGCDSVSDKPDVLPNLTQLHFIASLDEASVRSPALAPLSATPGLTKCMTITSYAPITHIQIQQYGITATVWQALPAHLQHLDCTMSVPLPSSSQTLLQLLSLKLHRWDNTFALSKLMTYLVRTPKCEVLELVNRPGYSAVSDCKAYVLASCKSERYADLVFLDNLVSSGLKVLPDGLNLHLSCDYSQAAGSISDFFAGLPTLTSINGLLLVRGGQIDRVFSIVDVLVPDVLPDRCPHITSFGLFGIGITRVTLEELKHLWRCTQLQHVSLACWKNISSYSTEAILALCAQGSFKVLQLQRRDLEIGTTGAQIQSQLDVSGSLVQINEYTDPRAPNF